MNVESYTHFCLQQPGATASFPFDKHTLVFKVMGKIFTLASIFPFERLNVKCDPEKAIALREAYPSVLPGYHMHKKHWNTILINQELTDHQIFEWIKDAYWLVVNQLPQKTKKALSTQNK
ncbi:MAG: MmcQ/YjbR family DNA-binding protein [Bacteroidota bacterium]